MNFHHSGMLATHRYLNGIFLFLILVLNLFSKFQLRTCRICNEEAFYKKKRSELVGWRLSMKTGSFGHWVQQDGLNALALHCIFLK